MLSDIMKRSRLKKGSKVKKTRLEKIVIRRVNDYDGDFIGSITIIHAPFKSTHMTGIYHHPSGDIKFSGEWEEGAFSIIDVKGIGNVEIVSDALSDLEQEITDHYRAVYTDEGDY